MPLTDLPRVRENYRLWWENRNTAPLLYLIFPDTAADYRPVIRPWMDPALYRGWSNWQQEFVFGQAVELVHRTGDWRYLDDALRLLEHYAEMTGHAGDGYPFLLPTLGPGCLSALLTGFTRFQGGTIWLELPEPLEWDALLALTDEPLQPYAEVALEATRRLVTRLQDRYVIALPDLGGPLDVLASLRGSPTLLLDTIDDPATLRQALEHLERLKWRFWDRFAEIIAPGNHDCWVETMRWLALRPTHISICDFSAMISPRDFAEFHLPVLQREVARFRGSVIYHMDGPGQIPHLDLLCGVRGLHAIQWVPGAGNPETTSEEWNLLYRRILDAGKKICLGGCPFDPPALRALFRRFPREAFFVPATLASREQAGEFLRAAEPADQA